MTDSMFDPAKAVKLPEIKEYLDEGRAQPSSMAEFRAFWDTFTEEEKFAAKREIYAAQRA